MARLPTLLLSATVALAACNTPGQPRRFDGIGNPHAPVVGQATHALDLATGGSGLAPGEADRAADWLASIGFGYGDRVSLDEGAGYGGSARAELARVIGRYGLVLSDTAPVTQGAPAPGSVRLVVLRAEASVPGCPDWESTPLLPQPSQPNFGCATAGNLAAMVADPNDLLAGKSAPDTGSSAATASKAIEALRGAKGTSAGGTTVRRESSQSAGSGGGGGGGGGGN